LTALFTHHLEYARDDLVVELHWALSTHLSFEIDYSRIWKERATLEFRNKNYSVLSYEYELVFQIISIFKDIELKTIILKSFLDTYKILKSLDPLLDWKAFFIDRDEEGLYTIAINILDLVLGIMDCYDDFPELSFYIEQKRKELKTKTLDEKVNLLNQERLGIWNKFWAFRLYRAHPMKTLGWWALSLPFRLAVYKKA
jgi:hypothetical protein